MEYNLVFQRVEMKYLLDEKQHAAFLAGIGPHMSVDMYGLSTITNIYYDSFDFQMARASIEGPEYKEKLRLRSYGKIRGDSVVFPEMKRKLHDTIYKRRVSMSCRTAADYLNRGIYPASEDCQVLREIDYLVKFYNVVPKILIAYERVAYVCPESPELRVTFDTGIRYRASNLDLTAGSDGIPYFSRGGLYLLEVKTIYAQPLWLTRLLGEIGAQLIPFSKYGNIYKRLLLDRTADTGKSGEYFSAINPKLAMADGSTSKLAI